MNTQAPVVAALDTNQLDREILRMDDSGDASLFDPRLIWSVIYRNRYLIASIVASALILALIVTMLMTPRYLATGSVQIEQQEAKVLESADTTPIPAVQDAERFLQTQLDILRSRSLAQRVMQSLNLDANDKFLVAMHQEPASEPLKGYDLPGTRREQIIATLLDNLKIDLPPNSRIVQVGFTSPDARLAARVANSYSENFIVSNLKRRFDTSTYARNFLSEQLGQAKSRLEDSERATIDYARSAGLIDASAGIANTAAGITGPRSLTASNLVQINAAYAQARAQRLDAQQQWLTAMRTPVMQLPEVLNNPTVQTLAQTRAQAQAAYEQERQRRKADYPAMQQAAANIAELDRQIARVAIDARDTIRTRYLGALKAETALLGNVSQLKLDTLSEQDRGVRYNILKRETDTNRAMYDALLQRYKEVSAAAGISANNISIIDVAETPTRPFSPKPLLNLIAGALAGLVIAGLVVLAREKFDDAVRSPDDISRKLGLTFLNSIPMLPAGEDTHAALADPRSGFSEAYAALRTSLELVTSAGLPKSLLFTSSRQSEGKSTSAYAISRDFARLGRRVILIDADLRKPSLHRLFGLPNTRGLASVLATHKSIEEVTQRTDLPNLDFISSGPLPPNPAELLASVTLPQAMKELDARYDLVVYDGPPVLGLADAMLLANLAGGTIFVIEANGSHHGHAKAAIRRLSASGARIMGALLTKFDAKKMGYGQYGYAYSYNYSYGVDVVAKS